jgi:hypothetical protein
VFGTDLVGCDPTDVEACLKAHHRQKNARLRKNASVGADLLFSASEAYFRPDGSSGVDANRVLAWREATLEAVRRRFGAIPAWRLDLDEHTPHLHVFVSPISERRGKGGMPKWEVSVRDQFGGASERMRELQDWYAHVMSPLGIQRGQPASVTGAEHRTPREMRRELATATETATNERVAAAADRDAAVQQLADIGRRERAFAEQERALSERESRITTQEAETRDAATVLEKARLAAAADASRVRAELTREAQTAAIRVADAERRIAEGEASLAREAETRLAAVINLEGAAAQRLTLAAEEQARVKELADALAVREAAIAQQEGDTQRRAMQATKLLDAATTQASEQAARQIAPVLQFVQFTRDWVSTVIERARPVPISTRSETIGLAHVLSNVVRHSDAERDRLLRKLGITATDQTESDTTFQPVFQRAFARSQRDWLSREYGGEVVALLHDAVRLAEAVKHPAAASRSAETAAPSRTAHARPAAPIQKPTVRPNHGVR